MDKNKIINKITEIGQCEDDAQRRELLTQLQEDINTDYDHFGNLETANNQLTADNETLRSANMKLFLRIGDKSKTQKDEPGEEKPKREFKNLFNEKGLIK